VHAPGERYAKIAAQLRGLLRRTPTCALHVHVSMPDAETAIRTCNGLREHLPLLQALAANSPFWHGRDSGLATARAQLFRGYPRSEIPRVFASFADYAETVDAVVAAGDLDDYTFVWWDVRPHPALGTVEVRAMDAQGPLWSVAGLAALVHALARHAARATIRLARPHARELGSQDALEELGRLLREGNGADRQRAAHARGGMPAVLALLVGETAARYP
jgi:carboxylate-amine ligase